LTHQRIVEFRNNDLLPLLFGEHNANLKHLEKKLGIHIADRGGQLTLSGDDYELETAEDILQTLFKKTKSDQEISKADIDAELRFREGHDRNTAKNQSMSDKDDIVIKTKRKTIAPRSPNQAVYLKASLENEMVFGLGPAGTGKTYLAVAIGVSMFLKGEVERLIFTRPAVEAGERLGFLPGDMKEKVDPYLRPIYDALHDMMDIEFMVKKMEAGEIEIAPLAFMRGRTLSNAFVILDEAQNTTTTHRKMFLTRMGEGTRMVINGDPSQIDLPAGAPSGLKEAITILGNIEDIGFMQFSASDVVRHKLVSRIIESYDANDFRTR